MQPRCLDLFCKAGGASVGYSRAGYAVTGVDHEAQPRYPLSFIQADALEYALAHGHEYDFIHASPPCQAYTRLRHLHSNEYPDMVSTTREVLQSIGVPWVIENVPGAPLLDPVVLCGTMFGLTLYRHRLFESSTPLETPNHPEHLVRIGSHRGGYDGNGDWVTVAGHNCRIDKARAAMEIPWMTVKEIAQAIPPAYTEYIGRSILHDRRGTRTALQ